MVRHRPCRGPRAARRRASGRLAALVGVGLLWALPGAAQVPVGGQAQAGGMTRERLAFDAADTDGDGRVSEAELARDAAAAFSALDKNRDRRLTRGELGEHDPRLFDRVDANRDGVLTFEEVMRFKIKGFEAADSDRDGALSFEEMTAGATKELESLR